MNVNQKGSIAEAWCMYQFMQKGWSVFRPINDYSPIDLIATLNYIDIYRISVKFRSLRDGLLTVNTDSSVNGKRVPCDKNLIDFWAVYVPEINTELYFNHKDMEESKGSFRFEQPDPKIAYKYKPVIEYSQYTLERILEGKLTRGERTVLT